MDKRGWTNDNETIMVGKMVRYTGRVQGVGFRYTAQHLAKDCAIAGYVRNLPNGDVELAAEGTASQVEQFLAAISRHLGGNIEQAFVEDVAVAGHKGFEIRF